MTTLREAAQQALEALEFSCPAPDLMSKHSAAEAALRAALEQPEAVLAQPEAQPGPTVKNFLPVQSEPSDEEIMAIAKDASVAYTIFDGATVPFWRAGEDYKPRLIAYARAVLALKPAVPEGWRLVPVEPSDDDIVRAFTRAGGYCSGNMFNLKRDEFFRFARAVLALNKETNHDRP